MRRIAYIVSCSVLMTALAMPAFAADGTWNVDADGDWGTAGNWVSSTIADGTDSTATFPNIITASRTNNLDSDRTIGNISFEDTGQDYRITNSTLTLDVTSGTPSINVTQSGRTLYIDSIIAGNDGLIKNGAGYLRMRGANTFTGGVTLNAGRIVIYDHANEQSFLGDSGNTLTFSADAELYNANGNVTIPQNVTISNGVTAKVTGAFGEDTYVQGVLAGSGTLYVQGFSAGFDARFENTANTFTGPIQVHSGDSATLRMKSLVDSANTIGLDSQNNNGGAFEYMSGAIAPLILNSRQFELIVDGSAGSNLGRQPTIRNAAGGNNVIIVNTDLLITGTGTKRLVLEGSNTSSNNFAGDIPDAIGSDVLHIHKQDGGTWALSGSNSYEGVTSVEGGTLIIQGRQALPSASTVQLTDGETIKLLDDGTGANVFGSDVEQGYHLQCVYTLFVGNNNTANGGNSSGTTTDSTNVMGSLTFNKNNTGDVYNRTVNVTGANDYRLELNDISLAWNGGSAYDTYRTAGRLYPTTAPVTISGTVIQRDGKTAHPTAWCFDEDYLTLDGTATNNIIDAAIADASDYTDSSNANAIPLGLHKRGSGEWILSSTNSFSGKTVITAGTLGIASRGSLPDTNSVTFSGTGVLDLNTGIKERVELLYFGAAQQASGKWGSTSSFATNQNDTYFAGEGILYVGVNVPAITNQTHADLTSTSVTFKATLECEADGYDVYVYWGETDETNQAGSWANSAHVGFWTNVVSTNISLWTNGLSVGTTYYYTFCASNANETIWASPSFSFMTLDAPVVNNSTGPTSDSKTSATLRGSLITGSVAEAWICWGSADGGVTSTSDWDNVVSMGTVTQGIGFSTVASGLETNASYWYRCFATNIYGADWSDEANAFNGTPVDDGPSGDTEITYPVSGAYFEWDSRWNFDTANWTSITANAFAWTFDTSGQSPIAVSDARFNTITNAYEFPASKDSSAPDFDGYGSSEPATFEFVLDVDTNTGVVFESGGTGDGIIIDVSGGAIRGLIEEDPTDVVTSYALTPTDSNRFIHVVFVADNANDVAQLYVDGDLKDSQTWAAGEDWSGTDDGGLGASFNAVVEGGETADFTGKIALFRYYRNTAFVAGQVTTNFNSLSSGGLIPNPTLNFDASIPDSGVDSTSWNSLTPDSSQDFSFGADVTLESVTSSVSAITKAYRFTGVTGATNQPQWEAAYEEQSDATWEFWIKPSDTGSPGAQQTIFEAGGTGDGVAIWYEPGSMDDGLGTVYFTVDDDTTQRTVSNVIDTTDFRHITAVYDKDNGGADVLSLFVDGLLKDSIGDTDAINDWSGSNQAGVGNTGAGSIAETASGGPYSGDITIFRFWESMALTSDQVMSNYTAVAPFANGVENLAPTNISPGAASLNAYLNLATGTNLVVYVHFGAADGGTNFGWSSGYYPVGSWTNGSATNQTYAVSYEKTGLKGSSNYWYTFRASNDAGNAWASPSWNFTAALPTDLGSVFIFK